MSNKVVAISDMGQRRQEQGRIRFGVKTATAMKAIETFRFTSPDREAIEQIAALYGGEAKAWSDAKANPQDQFEVITQAKVIRVYLPPGGLTCSYELWAGSGRKRMCDGVTCEVAMQSGPEPYVEAPCICDGNGRMECKPKTRLQVILPEIKLGGVWRLETGSWNAAQEMPAMEQMAQQLQMYGVIEAVLSLSRRSDLDRTGRKRHYVVPKIEFKMGAEALAAGAAQVAGLPQGGPRLALAEGNGQSSVPEPPALTGPQADDTEMHGESTVPVSGGDEDIVDAEIVEPEPTPPVETRAADLADRAKETAKQGGLSKVHKKLHALIGEVANQQIMDADTIRHGITRTATKDRTFSSSNLSDEEMSQVLTVLQDVLDGTRDIVIEEDGKVRVPKVGT